MACPQVQLKYKRIICITQPFSGKSSDNSSNQFLKSYSYIIRKLQKLRFTVGDLKDSKQPQKLTDIQKLEEKKHTHESSISVNYRNP